MASKDTPSTAMGRDKIRNKCIIDGVALSSLVQKHYIRNILVSVIISNKARDRKRNTAKYVIHNTARNTQSIKRPLAWGLQWL